MQNSNIADQLIRGSKNINIMWEEIKDLTSMIEGLMARMEKRALSFDLLGEGCYWEVRGETGVKHGVRIECRDDFLRPALFSSSYGVINRGVTSIQIVHNNLPVLIQGLFAKVEGLAEKCEPFIRAANR